MAWKLVCPWEIFQVKDSISEELSDTEKKEERALAILDPLQKYIAELRKYPPLTPEEESQLAVKYKEEGDLHAVYRLVTSNLMLVVKIAMSFNRAFHNLLDLIQEGNIGLMQAVKKFDPFKGVKLPTYATWWIRAYIIKYLIDNWRMVRIGTTNTRRWLLYNLKKEKERLEAKGFSPTPILLARKLDISEEDVVDVEQSLGAYDFSLNVPLNKDSDDEHIHFLRSHDMPIDEKIADLEIKDLLNKRITEFKEGLKEREIYILENRILSDNPVTLQEIGNQLSITREAVRQAEKRLKERLQRYLKKKLLPP